MFRIELLSWEKAREPASRIRFRVFVEEQGVPPEIELDEQDAHCLHALAFDEKGVAVGTGRLLPDAHIGRMAVLAERRRHGVGTLLLDKLIEAARGRGGREVLLSAQVHAVGFYRRHGFAPVGEIYEEAGIAHLSMRLSI